MSDPDIYRRLEALERWRDEQTGDEVPLLGSGTSGRIPQWDATGQTLEDSTLAKTGAGLVTINAASAFTLELAAGTWTPSLQGDGTAGTFTYSIQQGRWVRRGPLVWITATLAVSAITIAATGNLSIGGLPFVIRNTTNQRGGIAVGQHSFNLTAGCIDLTVLALPGEGVLRLAENFDNAATALLQGGSVTTGNVNIVISGEYETA